MFCISDMYSQLTKIFIRFISLLFNIQFIHLFPVDTCFNMNKYIILIIMIVDIEAFLLNI